MVKFRVCVRAGFYNFGCICDRNKYIIIGFLFIKVIFLGRIEGFDREYDLLSYLVIN